MTKLSPRLLACARLVTPGGVACDVGTDHAYLPVWLLEQGICTAATASDIGEGPLSAARHTVEQAGLSDRVTLCLTNGLQGLSPQAFTDIILAGMGGETIAEILGDAVFAPPYPQLILQPMTRAVFLREWLAANGFSLLREQAVQEGKHLYTVQSAQYCGEIRTLSPLEAEVGALDSHDATARAYIQRQADKLRRRALGAQSAGMDTTQELQLAEQLEHWTREDLR